VIVLRISRKGENVLQITLLLCVSEETQHYRYVKQVTAFLLDQNRNINANHCFMMCLNGFPRVDAQKSQKKLQWCEWKTDMDKDARREEIYSFFPKLSQTDEDAIHDIRGL